MKLESLKSLHYIPPNADLEYEESQRYKQLKGITPEQWRALVDSGHPVTLTPAMLADIGNSTATGVEAAQEAIHDLEPEKVERAARAVASGRVEYPIVLKDGDTLDLLGGNTRLTTIVAKGLTPKVLVIDITGMQK